MINCRAANNCSVIQGIFRRFSFSNGDLRVVNNRSTNAISVSIKLVEPEKSPVRTARLRSQSFGSSTDYYKETIRSMSGASDKIEKTNRLILEKSPYLLQHASNPVDWFPWGQEAFDKAKSENKLIFLSVGYSTCHWCHVMEKESFENPSVAAIMNAHFVNIKVDREERPDVDKLYMSFVTATVGGGGWPMSVFLTPDLKPLAGGTYFPPEDRYGRPGFKTVLSRIAKQWEEKRGALMDSSEHALQVLKKATINAPPGESLDVPSEEAWKKCFLQLSRSYEADFGGFNDAPKFPQPANFDFLFHMYSRNKTSEEGFQCLEMCLHTLRKMAYGGIHDHVNKGFARYSVDDRWHVPHFEKMLYDQAQLAVSYCDAFVLTKDAFFGDVVHDILEYVARDLSHPEGGFYGAEDADSFPFEGADEKKEGAFCVWERQEILRVLGGDRVETEVVEYHYNVKEEGNVSPAQDPHGELLNKNVLACFGSYEDTARKFDLSVEKVKEILEKSHRLLLEERRRRPRPHVDTKIVTAWNGLMISGYAKAGFVFKRQPYIDRAMRAAAFVRRFLYSEEERSLLRCCYKGEDGGAVVQTSTPISGFLDDYAFLIRGLLDLYEASLDADWLQWAETLQEQQDEMFWDEEDAGYFTSPKGDASILIRGKEDQDGAEPCGNSVSVHNLIRLAVYLQRQDLREKAGRTLAAFAPRLRSVPIALPEMTSALLSYHNSPTQVFIAGESDSTDTQALLDVVRARFLPGRVLALADGPGGQAGLLYSRHETLARLRPVHGKPAAYVCRNFACSLPVTEPHELATSLDAHGNGNGAPKEEEEEGGE